MIYAQHGPSWKPKIDLLLDYNLISGIIWDVREETLDRINSTRQNFPIYNSVTNFVDLKWYYKQFPNAFLKNLNNLPYIPQEQIDRIYLRDTVKLSGNINEIISFETDNNFILNTPALYISSFNERYIDKMFDMLEIFHDKVSTTSKYISLMIHESAFENDISMNEFLQDFSNYIQSYKGVYIVIDRDIVSNIRNWFPPERLYRFMKFIYSLKSIGFEVIIGYCGLESINYMAVGADIIGTGWFYSLRKFNKLEKGLDIYSSMGRAKKRYTSISFLNELSFDDNIKTIPNQSKDNMLNLIFNGNNIDIKIKSGNLDVIPMNETYIQYFEAMNQLSDLFSSKNTISDKLDCLEALINTAISNTKLYLETTSITKLSSQHLTAYKSAIDKFREENFI